MKFSENWLRELVNPPLPSTELVVQLTMLGLEVETITAAAELDKVVVGEVVALAAHPDADKLKIAMVAVGQDKPIQIVCGANNVKVGLKTPTALVGANLPGDFKIKAAKLRGVSSVGMLCSAQELALFAEADGLMELPADSTVGQNINETLGLPDNIIDVDLTPNRGDCLSMIGIAREIGVLNRLDVKPVPDEPVAVTSAATIAVEVQNQDSCPRYCARVIEDINANAITPLWMQEKLRRGGIRSISVLVDVTNFVMLELGQPLHAFDRAKIAEKIIIRNARQGESMTMLDGAELELQDSTLLIADNSKPLALAGIMGGEYSGISADTTTIVLECAFFTPQALAGMARKYGMHTEASHRYERGVDNQLQERAINRATALILNICGGRAGEVVDKHGAMADSKKIKLKASNIQRLLGVNMPTREVEDILSRLGCAVQEDWQITPPSWRYDINGEADIIEELGRVYGYDRLPATPLSLPTHLVVQPEQLTTVTSVKQYLSNRDYAEVITYSFVSPELLDQMGLGNDAIALKNPLSPELSVMRTSLLPGLVQTLQYNLNRQQKRIRLFETGLKFKLYDNEISQQASLAGLVCGDKYVENWHDKSERANFFDVKQDLLPLLWPEVEFVAAEYELFHPGQCADIIKDGQQIGRLGKIHPGVAHRLDIPDYTILYELVLAQIQDKPPTNYQPLSKFPLIRRDLAFFVNNKYPAHSIIAAIRRKNISNLQDVSIFDVYRGGNTKDHEYSLALALSMQQSDRTMADDDVELLLNQVINIVKSEFKVIFRD